MENNKDSNRREWLKAMITLPLAGTLAYGLYKRAKTKKMQDDFLHLVSEDVTIQQTSISDQPPLKIGLIGCGNRGKYILKALGFYHPDEILKLREAARISLSDTRYRDMQEQSVSPVHITAVCDIFQPHMDYALIAASNRHRTTNISEIKIIPEQFKEWRQLITSSCCDAVIIATPDHWHASMAIEAAHAGKHVYMEKPAAWTLEEAFDLRNALTDSDIVFQLGHQNRQVNSYLKARDIINKGLLGKISLIETSTSRNDENGAWVYPIHEQANKHTVDWEAFSPDPIRKAEFYSYMLSHNLQKFMKADAYSSFNAEHFFRWRCWWEYSSGLIGDLFTHEYDAVNQIMQCGIPASVTASGGIYKYKDGRTVPDVLQISLEFPNQDFSMLYSATLGNSMEKPKRILGSDAMLDINNSIEMYVDASSQRYKKELETGSINPEEPVYTFIPGKKDIDVISTATERYFARRGLLYSWIGDKRFNTTYLHILEWINAIYNNKQTSCGIREAFEESVTSQLASRAYLEGRTKYWDDINEVII
ncbi:MAG: Gfo/Idh/MocA family oxidoreductase [Bacteroidales bacterium]